MLASIAARRPLHPASTALSPIPPAPAALLLYPDPAVSRASCTAGIDCMYCTHVVLYDFPRDPSEYVRRVGRTARGAGGKGVVTSLVLGRQVR